MNNMLNMYGIASFVKEQHKNEMAGHRNQSQKEMNIFEKIDAIDLACTAMWALVSETLQVDDSKLQEAADAIDASDGQTDGKLTRLPVQCECGAKNAPYLKRCLYCGTDLPNGCFFTV